jgi:catechol 2,3-dioxygenase-like lactoylglutathione lyase family enzyme
MNTSLRVSAIDHVGLRVLDAARAEAFYARLGFRVTYRDADAPVVILRNEAGVELNLIVNAEARFDGRNALMDEADKRAGITHLALRVASLDAAQAALARHGVVITEGPVRLGGALSLFLRDPDRNVIELREG